MDVSAVNEMEIDIEDIDKVKNLLYIEINLFNLSVPNLQIRYVFLKIRLCWFLLKPGVYIFVSHRID